MAPLSCTWRVRLQLWPATAVGDRHLRRRRYDDVHISIALANSGDVQLELIQQRCETPGMYRDFLAARHEGMQHWSNWPENYDEIYQRALATGYTVGQEGDSPRGRGVSQACVFAFLVGTCVHAAVWHPARGCLEGVLRSHCSPYR